MVVGIPGTCPKTRIQRVVGWIGLTLMLGFIAYVLIQNLVRRLDHRQPDSLGSFPAIGPWSPSHMF